MTHSSNIKKPPTNGTYQKGVAAIEFALLIVLLLAIATGLIEFGKTFWYYNALTKATRDSARYLSMEQTITSSHITTAKNRAVTAARAANVPDDFTTDDVEVTCDPDCTAPTYVTVQINDYELTIGGWIPVFIPTGTTTWVRSVSPYTTMRYMR